MHGTRQSAICVSQAIQPFSPGQLPQAVGPVLQQHLLQPASPRVPAAQRGPHGRTDEAVGSATDTPGLGARPVPDPQEWLAPPQQRRLLLHGSRDERN